MQRDIEVGDGKTMASAKAHVKTAYVDQYCVFELTRNVMYYTGLVLVRDGGL